MQDNIYAAPEAALTDTEVAATQPAFYIVSPAKLLALFFFTFGFYGFYWHFKNWKLYKLAYQDDAPMPIMRAIFSIFLTHALFTVIDARIKEKAVDYQWQPGLWAAIAVIALLASRIIDRVTADGTFSTALEFVPFPLMILYGLVLLRVQFAINASCDDPQGKSNSNFTLANCVWIFFGAAFFSLIIIALLLPDLAVQ
jgi:hypothetical protein